MKKVAKTGARKSAQRTPLKNDFSASTRFHLIGIGGSGMSSLALLLHAAGKVVSGSDIKLSKAAEMLALDGIKVIPGQDIEVIPKNAEAIIYSAAVPELDPKFFRALKKLGRPLFEYHEAVGEYAKNKHTVAVSGTHGKTTTTAMIASILKAADTGASALVGGVMHDMKSSVHIGNGDTFVVEADEYKGGFLHLNPSVLVITNIDHDHVNDFPTLGDVQKVFKKLVKRVSLDGVIVCDPNDPHVAEVIKDVPQPVIDYTSISLEGVELKLPGDHNRKNAKAALAAAGVLGISLNIAKLALSNFSGTGRRFEKKGEMKNGALIFDDYAHNPEKVRAAIQGAREAHPTKELTVVFQPHLFSRTKQFLNEFAETLSVADYIVVLPIYAAREKLDLSVTSHDLVKKIKELNKNVLYFATFDEVIVELKKRTGSKDIIMTVGAGDITKVSDMLVS